MCFGTAHSTRICNVSALVFFDSATQSKFYCFLEAILSLRQRELMKEVQVEICKQDPGVGAPTTKALTLEILKSKIAEMLCRHDSNLPFFIRKKD